MYKLFISGAFKDVKLRSGQILVECSKKKSLTQKTYWLICWQVFQWGLFPHPSLKNCKGVICTRDLLDMEETKIAADLQQGAMWREWLFFFNKNQTVKTGTFHLYIQPVPMTRKLSWILSASVDTFITNPLRCFNCQKFGHGSAGCKIRQSAATVVRKNKSVPVQEHLNVLSV